MKQVIFCILGLWKFLWSPRMCTLFIKFSDADFIITSWLMKQYTEFSALVICWDNRVTHRSRYELNFELLEVGSEVSLVWTPLQSWAQHRIFIKYLLELVLVMRTFRNYPLYNKILFKKKKKKLKLLKTLLGIYFFQEKWHFEVNTVTWPVLVEVFRWFFCYLICVWVCILSLLMLSVPLPS